MTTEQYIDQVGRVQQFAPRHPLLPTLIQGHSKINEIYLAHALRAIETEQAAQVPLGLKKCYARKSMLFGQRDRLSNQMCDLDEDAKNDAKRADFSRRIQAVQRDIEAVMTEIAALEAGQVLPTENAPRLPTDRAELVKKRASLRSSISQQRARLKSPKKAVREAAMAKIKELEDLLAHVEVALNR